MAWKGFGRLNPSFCPGNCGRDRENCKTLRSVHSILDLPQASQPFGMTSRGVALPLNSIAGGLKLMIRE